MAYRIEKTVCSGSGCEKSFVPHRWGTMEASRSGWFLQRNGDSWCPDHIPDWVIEWRKKKEAR